MTLPTMKADDVVRLSLQARVRTVTDKEVEFLFDGETDHDASAFFSYAELTAPTARVEVLPPPIDPDLVLAREWLKTAHPSWPTCLVDTGECDTCIPMVAFLAGWDAATKQAAPVVDLAESLAHHPDDLDTIAEYRRDVGAGQ